MPGAEVDRPSGDHDTSSERAVVGHLRVVDDRLVGSLRRSLAGVRPTPGLVFSCSGPASHIGVFAPRNVILRRTFLFSIWEHEHALDRAEASWPPLGPGDGWSVRLDPLRGWQRGEPRLDLGPVTGRPDAEDGPVLSVTTSQAYLRRLPRFLLASRPVEKQVLGADGLVWTMGFSQPPSWFGTLSYWESAAAAAKFARSDADRAAHRNAARSVDRWFRRSLVIRFRPRDGVGSLRNEPRLPVPG